MSPEVVCDVSRDYWWDAGAFALVLAFMVLWTSLCAAFAFRRDKIIAYFRLDTPKPGIFRDLLFGAHRALSLVFFFVGLIVTASLVGIFVGTYFQLADLEGRDRACELGNICTSIKPGAIPAF